MPLSEGYIGMEESLDKLGTVLAVANEINRDTLELLRDSHDKLAEQQKRQTDILKTSMALVGGAFIIVLAALFFVGTTVCTLRDNVQKNTEAIRYVQPSQTSERLHQ